MKRYPADLYRGVPAVPDRAGRGKDEKEMKFKVLGTGSYIPPKVVTNDDLSHMVETNDEWISKRVGIKERHVSVDETTSQMAAKAAEKALENSCVKAEELDLILAATISGEYANPGVATMTQMRIGASCPAIDIGGVACTGFIYLIETAAAFLALGKAKKILLVGAERLSGIVDWNDRSTCIIFADGAGAMVVSNEGDNLLASAIHTQGNDEIICIPHVTGTSPFYEGEAIKEPFIHMNGKETYKFAVNSMRENILDMMEQAHLQDEDIRWVVPHQANIRIINEAKRKLPIAPEKFCSNIERTGNTSSASVAILLDELNRSGQLERGDKIILVAFGGGLCHGACAIEW